MTGIGKKGATASLWSALSTLGRFFLQLIAQVVLARLLGPEVYGVFGLGLVALGLCNLLATFGFAWSLAQLPQVSEEDVRFAFTWQLVVGLVAAVTMYVSAPWSAAFFADARAEPVMRWLSLACLLTAATSVSGNLMRRNMDFRSPGIIQIVSYAVGYIAVGIPLAWLGAGVYALVAAWVCQAAVVAAASFWRCPHAWRPLFRSPQAGAMTRIGATVLVTNLGNWLSSSLDRLMVGRMLNAHAVGVYSAGFNLANMPNSLLLGALQPVFLTAGARVQDERAKLKGAYEQIVAAIWVLLLPCFICLAVVAPDVIAVLYGPAWEAAGGVLAILFVAMPAYLTWGMSTPVLWNTGRAHLEFLLQLPLIPLAMGGFYFFASQGVIAAAAVAAATLAIRGAVMGFVAFRVLEVKLPVFLGAVGRGLCLAACSVGPVWLIRNHHLSGWGPLERLLVSAAVALLMAFVVLLGAPGALGVRANAMISRFVSEWPRWLAYRRRSLASAHQKRP